MLVIPIAAFEREKQRVAMMATTEQEKSKTSIARTFKKARSQSNHMNITALQY